MNMDMEHADHTQMVMECKRLGSKMNKSMDLRITDWSVNGRGGGGKHLSAIKIVLVIETDAECSVRGKYVF